MLIYLIVGRTASGKNYFANLLTNKGLRRAISYTTRPKREHETDDDYHFISPMHAKLINPKLAPTKINNYDYFITEKELQNKDIFIIDPQGVIDLAKALPDAVFHVLYLEAPLDQRKKHFIQRAKYNKIKNPEEEFNKRNQNEKERFDEFEKVIKADDPYSVQNSKYALPKNIYAISPIKIDYENFNETNTQASRFVMDKRFHNRLINMVKKAPELGLIRKQPTGKLLATLQNKSQQNHQVELTPESYCEYLLANSGAFTSFMIAMLTNDRDLDKIYPE